MAYKMYSVFYDSIKGFVDDVSKKPEKFKDKFNKCEWYKLETSTGGFHGNFNNIVKTVATHNVKREASMLAGVMNEINSADFIERSWEYKQRLEEGDIIDVNRYLDGHEKFWCGVKRSWRTKQVVRVYTGAGGNCGRSKEELAICGAVAVTLTEILESMGIGVELWSISPVSGLFTNGNDGQTLIKLKGSDEFADLGMINYITGNDTVFRNGVFRSWAKLAEHEGFTLDCGLGRMKTPTAKDIGLEDCEADTAIIVPQMFDVATAKKWLLDLMKALPSKMNGKKEGE
jgi:hypothetical protein